MSNGHNRDELAEENADLHRQIGQLQAELRRRAWLPAWVRPIRDALMANKKRNGKAK